MSEAIDKYRTLLADLDAQIAAKEHEIEELWSRKVSALGLLSDEDMQIMREDRRSKMTPLMRELSDTTIKFGLSYFLDTL